MGGVDDDEQHVAVWTLSDEYDGSFIFTIEWNITSKNSRIIFLDLIKELQSYDSNSRF